MPKYRSLDERVLSHMIHRIVVTDEFLPRQRARYGLLSMTAAEFDAILLRHGITTCYNPDTKGQQYKVSEVLAAYKELQKQLAAQTPTNQVFAFPAEEDEQVQRS